MITKNCSYQAYPQALCAFCSISPYVSKYIIGLAILYILSLDACNGTQGPEYCCKLKTRGGPLRCCMKNDRTEQQRVFHEPNKIESNSAVTMVEETSKRILNRQSRFQHLFWFLIVLSKWSWRQLRYCQGTRLVEVIHMFRHVGYCNGVLLYVST